MVGKKWECVMLSYNYELEVLGMIFQVYFGKNEPEKVPFYGLRLVTKRDRKMLAERTLYIGHPEDDVKEGDLDILLRNANLVFNVPRIPKKQMDGFRVLIAQLENEV